MSRTERVRTVNGTVRRVYTDDRRGGRALPRRIDRGCGQTRNQVFGPRHRGNHHGRRSGDLVSAAAAAAPKVRRWPSASRPYTFSFAPRLLPPPDACAAPT